MRGGGGLAPKLGVVALRVDELRNVRRGVGVGEPPLFGRYGDERIMDRMAHLRSTTDEDDATTLLNRGPYCRAIFAQQVLDIHSLSGVVPREGGVQLREDASARPVEQFVLVDEMVRASLCARVVVVEERARERKRKRERERERERESEREREKEEEGGRVSDRSRVWAIGTPREGEREQQRTWHPK